MAEIKKINVDGVDYDIVSESAERKIAALEKTNAALNAVTFGTRDTQTDFIHVGIGIEPSEYKPVKDVFIGKGAYIGESVQMGTEFPILMRWDSIGNFLIESDGGNRGTITIGSNVNLTGGSTGGGGNIPKEINILGSGTINIYDSVFEVDSESLTFGKGDPVTMQMYGDMLNVRCNSKSMELMVASKNSHVLRLGYGIAFRLGNWFEDAIQIGANVHIGTGLTSGDTLDISGPVYLKATSGVSGLTIGTNGMSAINIDWESGDKIVFTHIDTGKKATLTLS